MEQKRFRYRKITPKIKKEMKILRKSGMSYKSISDIFKISKSTVGYHLNPKEREGAIERAKQYYKKLSKNKKREKERKRLKYKTDYYKDRYLHDEKFRRKLISQITAYQKRKKLEKNAKKKKKRP